MDLEKELQALTSQAPEGEEARNGKTCFRVHGHDPESLESCQNSMLAF